MHKVWQNIKLVFKNFFLFVSSKVFLKNFVGIVASIVGFIVLIFVFIHFFTRNGHAMETPEMVGLSILNAKKEYPYLRFNVDSIYYTDTVTGKSPKPLTILSQDPPPKSLIKKGRNIYVNIQQYNRPMTSLPRIWGKSYHRALVDLDRKQLKGVVFRKRPDKAYDTVLEAYTVNSKGDTVEIQSYDKKAPQLKEGTIIYLTVAEGMGEEVALPNCRCKTFDLAKFLLDGSNLEIGSIYVDIDVVDTSAAYVSRQYPTFINGKTANKGEEINLWLMKGVPENCAIDEDFIDVEPDIPPPGN